MSKREFTFLSKDGKTAIHAIEWKPEGEIKGILQICHGMVEFIDRYDAFASFLNKQGYLVIGHDHLGHGKSVTSEAEYGYFGHPDGNAYVIEDIHALRQSTQQQYPALPYFILGHSMGSFLTRQYLTTYAEGLSGAIIMGTGSQPQAVLGLAKGICSSMAKIKGWHYRSEFVNNLAMGSYNKPFEPTRTSADWLTKDEAIVDAYLANPWCTFVFTINGYYQMFSGIEIAQRDADKVPKTLPMFIVSGKDDPVGNFGKGVKQVYEDYQAKGIKDIVMKLYVDDRHEILNETDKHAVYVDILTWMDQHR